MKSHKEQQTMGPIRAGTIRLITYKRINNSDLI